jgi:hypothetical protein
MEIFPVKKLPLVSLIRRDGLNRIILKLRSNGSELLLPQVNKSEL